MAQKKPADIRQMRMRLNHETFRQSVENILVSPVSRVVEMLHGDDADKDELIIDMAIARCAYSAYFDADFKKLEWLLERAGVNKVEEQNSVDLSQLTNEAIVTALKGK